MQMECFKRGWKDEISPEAHDRFHGYCRSSDMPIQYTPVHLSPHLYTPSNLWEYRKE